jgi:hypothetical protein
MSNLELAAVSLASLKDGSSAMGTFLSFTSLQEDHREAPPPASQETVFPLETLETLSQEV